MAKHKLLILALAGVVPMSGAQAPAVAEPIQHDSQCPYARAEMAAAEREAVSGTVVASTASVAMFEGPSGLAP